MSADFQGERQLPSRHLLMQFGTVMVTISLSDISDKPTCDSIITRDYHLFVMINARFLFLCY